MGGSASSSGYAFQPARLPSQPSPPAMLPQGGVEVDGPVPTLYAVCLGSDHRAVKLLIRGRLQRRTIRNQNYNDKKKKVTGLCHNNAEDYAIKVRNNINAESILS